MQFKTSPSVVLLLLGASSSAIAKCIGPPVNQATLDLVKEFEGWIPGIYDDPVGLPTVGYGHLCEDKSCSDVPYGIPLSRADGEELLQADIETAQQCITMATKTEVILNANQYGVLVSWAFNVGCPAAGSSTLIERLNAGESPDTVAEQELPLWRMGGGEVLPGLVRRREAEVELHKTPTSVGALPVRCYAD